MSSGFAYGRSEASPASEQMKPIGATLQRRNSASEEQIQESGFAYGHSEASPASEQMKPIVATLQRRNSVSEEQIQEADLLASVQ